MKTLLHTFFIMIMPCALIAQIPNYGFETWSTTSTEIPQDWSFLLGEVTKVTPASSGSYAIKLEKSSVNSDGPGVVMYGQSNDGVVFTGGTPFSNRPDSIVADFKYDLVTNDSAWVLVFFKSGGTFISQDLFKIYGSNPGSFVRKAFAINYTSGATPDSVIVGFTSTDPDSSFTGSYVIIDNIRFTNTSNTVFPLLNGSFESWTAISYDEPTSWNTTNSDYVPLNNFPVSKTTDKRSGSYAVKIQNKTSQSGVGFEQAYILSGSQGNSGPLPGFPVSARETVFNGFYKFTKVGNDTATIGVMMFSGGTAVGWAEFTAPASATAYTSFTTTINYDGSFLGIPDSATVYAMPNNGDTAFGGSVLIVDDLSFGDTLPASPTPTGIERFSGNGNKIEVYPNPSSDVVNIDFTLQQTADVLIEVANLNGQHVLDVYSGKKESGKHTLSVDVSDLSPGVYSINITIDTRLLGRKIIVK